MASDQHTCDHELRGSGQPVGYLLMCVHRALRAAIDETLRPHGFTLPQVTVMFALARKSGLSTAELARRAFVTPQAMGEVLAGLEAKGCVIRRAHDSHGRILPTELTEAGIEARALCHEILAKAEGLMLSGLSAEERQSLGALLERCLEGLHDSPTEDLPPVVPPRLRSRSPKVRAGQ
jgi:DNA-binding MarR family transcriptional regulator